MTPLPIHPALWHSHGEADHIRARGESCASCRWSRPSRMYPDGLGGEPVSECVKLWGHPGKGGRQQRQMWPADCCTMWEHPQAHLTWRDHDECDVPDHTDPELPPWIP